MKNHYFDGTGICIRCDLCAVEGCCSEEFVAEECRSTNWDFMGRMKEIAKDLLRKRENGK